MKAGLRTDSRRCAYQFDLAQVSMPANEQGETQLPVAFLRTANPENIDAINARGVALWNSIYEPHAIKLHDKLASYHPDLICTSPVFPTPPP